MDCSVPGAEITAMSWVADGKLSGFSASHLDKWGYTISGGQPENALVVELFCLPDTVDPRGPKGK